MQYLQSLAGSRGVRNASSRIRELLDVFAVENSYAPMNALSQGNLQKINLIQSFLHEDPHIYIADEPTNGLDSEARALYLQYLDTLASKIPVIVASHDIQMLSEICRVAFWFRKGKLIYKGWEPLESTRQARIITTLSSENFCYFDVGEFSASEGVTTWQGDARYRMEVAHKILDLGGELIEVQKMPPSLARIYAVIDH